MRATHRALVIIPGIGSAQATLSICKVALFARCTLEHAAWLADISNWDGPCWTLRDTGLTHVVRI